MPATSWTEASQAASAFTEASQAATSLAEGSQSPDSWQRGYPAPGGPVDYLFGAFALTGREFRDVTTLWTEQELT